MSDATRSIALSLIAHTNAGKTTLARTLLGRDVGEVRDEAHVTEVAEEFLLTQSEAGDRLLLWDTPGFGDSLRLARRLESSGQPIGWLLTQVWDRYRDRPMWCSQQAVRNVRDHADVVLYLVNASEDPSQAGYLPAELRILDWAGKPVVALLNQIGQPLAPEAEHAEIERWREVLGACRQVRAVLAFDAFARCWVQESAIFDAIASSLPEDRQPAFQRLRDVWRAQRTRVFDQSIAALAARIARAATDREAVPDAGFGGQLRSLGKVIGLGRNDADGERTRAMSALAMRLDEDIRASTDRLIAINGLEGAATEVVLKRLAEHYKTDMPLAEGKAAVLGGLLTGALAGLKADIATGGLTLGGGLIAGGLLGAFGAAGLARGYNLVRGVTSASVFWTEEVLHELAASALLAYLAVAHYGRGRGQWSESEHPPHWDAAVRESLAPLRARLQAAWAERTTTADTAALARAIEAPLHDAAITLLRRLYPGAI